MPEEQTVLPESQRTRDSLKDKLLFATGVALGLLTHVPELLISGAAVTGGLYLAGKLTGVIPEDQDFKTTVRRASDAIKETL
ncbi:hypothetical protein GF362_01565 [Candidatus Dojkabacteria bacterium]|nr:hypothetical protein [Candidatus Dojkabacteria bacterium]